MHKLAYVLLMHAAAALWRCAIVCSQKWKCDLECLISGLLAVLILSQVNN